MVQAMHLEMAAKRSMTCTPVTSLTTPVFPQSAPRRLSVMLFGVLMICVIQAGSVHAGRVENPVAVFAALDKVTARISQLEVPLNQTVRFGSLQVTPRVCFTRDPTEPPKTTTFVEVNEVALDGQETRLFSGWMFAESPGLNAVQHPVFDVWLTACKGGQSSSAASGSEVQRGDGENRPRRQRRRRRVRQ
ncbi:MAG: DUF2155 domain-containing protein [Pseudomonadota bacterium]